VRQDGCKQEGTWSSFADFVTDGINVDDQIDQIPPAEFL
jgi:hypothetical protein